MDCIELEKLHQERYEKAKESITPNSKWVDADGGIFVVISYEDEMVILREQYISYVYSRSVSSFLHTFSLKGDEGDS